MKKLAAVLLLAGASATALASVDTTPSWNGSDSVYYWGEPDTSTYGQTFTVGADNVLNSFTFYLQQDGSSTTGFKAYVFAWDSANSRATGTALYESAASSTDDNEGSGGFDEITFSTGGLNLTPGGEYVAFFSLSDFHDGDLDDYHAWGHTKVDAQSGGEFVFINNGSDTSQWTTLPWTLAWYGSGTDLAYKMDFSRVPTPTSALLGMLGLAASGLWRKRS